MTMVSAQVRPVLRSGRRRRRGGSGTRGRSGRSGSSAFRSGGSAGGRSSTRSGGSTRGRSSTGLTSRGRDRSSAGLTSRGSRRRRARRRGYCGGCGLFLGRASRYQYDSRGYDENENDNTKRPVHLHHPFAGCVTHD